jgi:hypothetical protein
MKIKEFSGGKSRPANEIILTNRDAVGWVIRGF